MTKARFIILACLSCFVISLLWAGQKVPSDLKSGFSHRYAFEPGKEIPLDAAVGWIHFDGMKVEARQKQSGLLLKIFVIAHNSKASDDHDAFVRVSFEDKDGNVLGTAVGKKQIEQGDEGKIKAEVVIPGWAVKVDSFTLELAVPGA